MTAVAAIGAVQARIQQIEQQFALRRPVATPASPATSPTASIPGTALGASALGEVGASAAVATPSIDSISSLSAALGIDDPSALGGIGGTDVFSAPGSSASGVTGLEGLASGAVPGTTGSFDDVFAAAVQRLRLGWNSTAVPGAVPGAVATPALGATTGLATATATSTAASSAPTTVAGVSVAGGVDPSTPHAALFEAAGARYGIPPRVLAAMGWVESRFRTDAVSSAGAVGMMQFLPGTAASMGVDPYDPASAIDGAARYLRSALDRFGSLEEAIAAYNVGPGAIARAGGVQPGSQAERYLTKVIEATGTI